MDEGAKWRLLAAAAVVALAVFALVRMLDRAESGAGPVRVSRPGPAPAASSPDGHPAGPTLFVHVTGAVRHPGVYRLPQEARVVNAVDRAGGPARRANLDAVNLAAPLADGQQVVVPARVAGAAASAPGASGDGPTSLATATAADLEELDGIGETLAERIVEYRTEHGGLRSIDELAQVDGIGEKRLEALKDELQP